MSSHEQSRSSHAAPENGEDIVVSEIVPTDKVLGEGFVYGNRIVSFRRPARTPICKQMYLLPDMSGQYPLGAPNMKEPYLDYKLREGMLPPRQVQQRSNKNQVAAAAMNIALEVGLELLFSRRRK